MRTLYLSLVGWVALAAPALADPVARVKGVNQFARRQGEAGPDHLLVGLFVLLAIAACVGFGIALKKQGRKAR